MTRYERTNEGRIRIIFQYVLAAWTGCTHQHMLSESLRSMCIMIFAAVFLLVASSWNSHCKEQKRGRHGGRDSDRWPGRPGRKRASRGYFGRIRDTSSRTRPWMIRTAKTTIPPKATITLTPNPLTQTWQTSGCMHLSDAKQTVRVWHQLGTSRA